MQRIIYVQKSPESDPTELRYDILDSAGHRKEADFVGGRLLTLQEVADLLAREGISFSSIGAFLSELRTSGSAQVQAPPRLGPRIVRAWFDTVLNPLVDFVELELGLLESRNWTFSFASQTLELIQPIQQHIHNANLEQILEMNIELSAHLHAHDSEAERLRSSVTALHAALVSSREFIELCDSLISGAILEAPDVREIFGAYPVSDRYNLIAQYVVNSAGELPPQYSTAKFWNQNREILLNCLIRLPNVREQFASVVPIAQHLAGIGRTLVSQVKNLRQELSLRYDVPIFLGSRHKLTA